MELEGEVQGRQDQAQKSLKCPNEIRELHFQKISHHLPSVVSAYGQERSGQGSGHSSSISSPISNWQEHLEPRLFNCGRNWCWQ